MQTKSVSEILLPLMREAGEMMLRAHEIESAENMTAKWGDANFVTVYDVAVQEHLMRGITSAIPTARFIAEEQDNDPTVLSSESCFIIDPIDGTTNFIRDYRHSCISVAMLSNGVPMFGAVYDPYLGELFHAEKGKGAYIGDRPIHISERPMELAIVAYGTATYYKDRFADRTFALCKDIFLSCADIRRCGSAALDLAYTAAGRNDAFFECILSPWDIAAGYVLITEAGGIITDMNGAPIDFSAPSSVIAANPQIYPTLLKKTKEIQ